MMTNLKNSIRKAIFSNLSQNSIDRFYRFYYKAKYPNQMGRSCSYGPNNPDKVFYIIRPRTDGTEGLMSLFMNVVKNIYFAEENNYIPVVDFENYHTQYKDSETDGDNPWEFYFTQPSDADLDEAYHSKNVVLSGLEMQWYRPAILRKDYSKENLKTLHDFIFEKIQFSENVLAAVKDEMKKLRLDCAKTLGLYLRGTDYVAIKPSGHPIQPTIEEAIEMVDSFLGKYPINYIFLVTEDRYIYEEIKKTYRDRCTIATFDSFIANYSGKNYLSHDKCLNELGNSPYRRGLNYLVKLIIISQCAYFIGGDTMGAWAACTFSGGCYKDKFIFDLGVYGK